MKNLYGLDKFARVFISISLFYYSGANINIYSILATMLLLTAVSNFCPIYKFLSINKKYAQKLEYLSQLPNNNPEPILIFDKFGNVIYQNNSSKMILPDIKSLKNLSNLSPEDIIKNEKNLSTKYKYKDKIYMIETLGIKEKSYILAYGFNITSIEKSREKLELQNITDSLTSLGNRTKLLEDIAKIQNNNLSLVAFDIIKFSEINGFFGHQKGDQLLKQFAEELNNFKTSLKFNMQTYRLSGNTFAFLLDFENLDKDTIERKFNEIITSFLTLFNNLKMPISDINITAKIRVGIASTCNNSNESNLYSSLLNNTETALSEAKREFLHILYFKDIENINDKYKENLRWASKLHDIFEHKSEAKLKAYFQPIYNLHANKIEKFECLARVEKGDDVILPFKFLDVAKQIDYLPKITEEVLSQALNIFKNTDYKFSINITTQDLKDEEILNKFCKVIDLSGFKKSSVVIEILEDEDVYKYTDMIAKFKEKGFKIAIDDFGTGYSNFQKLQMLNIDFIKIDGSLVKNIATNSKDLSIINSICAYAKAIGVKTIAEFVSDDSIFELVKKSGVDYAQGCHIGAPKPDINVEFNA